MLQASPDINLPLLTPESHFPLRVRLASGMTDDALYALCLANRDLRIERTADGELIVMSPTGGETSRRNATLTCAISLWAAKEGTGIVFDSNGGFILPSGAERAPDVAWVRKERWEALTRDERERFPPLCPDFVLELRSPSDALEDLHNKMREYAENGARLGWLVDPESRRVWVYEGRGEAVCLDQPERVKGGDVLEGFVLEMGGVW
jgi:Uma2 family endonuclease